MLYCWIDKYNNEINNKRMWGDSIEIFKIINEIDDVNVLTLIWT